MVKPIPGVANSVVGESSSFSISPKGTIPVGSTVIITAAERTPSNPDPVTDDAGNVYERLDSQQTGLEAVSFVWGCLSTTAELTPPDKVSVPMGGMTKAVISLEGYSGCLSFGNTGFGAPSTSDPTIDLTTQDPGNLVAASFAGVGTGAFSELSGSGTLETSGVTTGHSPKSNIGGALVDLEVPSPGTVTLGCVNPDTFWAVTAVELRSVA